MATEAQLIQDVIAYFTAVQNGQELVVPIEDIQAWLATRRAIPDSSRQLEKAMNKVIHKLGLSVPKDVPL